MEESQPEQPLSFQQQLLNLSTLEQQIQKTKQELSQLIKI